MALGQIIQLIADSLFLAITVNKTVSVNKGEALPGRVGQDGSLTGSN
jgi:hypothetical protein